jgi:subtilase family serine protease
VQGFPQMMAAEKYVVDHHLANVISQSFGAGEEAFHATSSLLNLRDAFTAAAQNGVTVLASSGDGGSSSTRSPSRTRRRSRSRRSAGRRRIRS